MLEFRTDWISLCDGESGENYVQNIIFSAFIMRQIF
jgi:hypothetical protein